MTEWLNLNWTELSIFFSLLIMVTHSNILAWKSHGWRSLVSYRPWGCRELDTAEWLQFCDVFLSLCWSSHCGHLFFSRVSCWLFCWTLYGVLTYLCFIHFFLTFYIGFHALDKTAASPSLERVALCRRWILLFYHALTFFSQTWMITNAVYFIFNDFQ